MKFLMSRFGLHSIAIGKGKSSDSNLPEVRHWIACWTIMRRKSAQIISSSHPMKPNLNGWVPWSGMTSQKSQL